MLLIDFSASVRGYHILYGKMKTAVMGEQLLSGNSLRKQKPGLNMVDRYAMVMKKDFCITTGHPPQKIAVLYKEVRYVANSHSYRLPMIFFRSIYSHLRTYVP